MVCLYFYFFWFNLRRLCISESIHISSGLFQFINTWYFIFFSYGPLYFCGVSCNVSSFIYGYIYLCPSSFSSWWVWLKIYQFTHFFQKTNSVFIAFNLCLLFCFELYYILSSTSFGFWLFFSSHSFLKLDSLIFSHFLKLACVTIKLPLGIAFGISWWLKW